MYYEEQIINGILSFRTSPNGEWQPMSREQLTARIVEHNTKLAGMATEVAPDGAVMVEAVTINEGDIVVLDGVERLVEDIGENSRMGGVWLHCGGLSRFFDYHEKVGRVV